MVLVYSPGPVVVPFIWGERQEEEGEAGRGWAGRTEVVQSGEGHSGLVVRLLEFASSFPIFCLSNRSASFFLSTCFAL